MTMTMTNRRVVGFYLPVMGWDERTAARVIVSSSSSRSSSSSSSTEVVIAVSNTGDRGAHSEYCVETSPHQDLSRRRWKVIDTLWRSSWMLDGM